MSAEPSAYEWTRADFDFVARVARATQRLGLDDPSPDTMWGAFGFCANLWGPMSPPALGCLLALVREAWWAPGLNRVVFCAPAAGGGFSVRMVTSVMGQRVERPLPGMAFCSPYATEAEALVAALEARP